MDHTAGISNWQVNEYSYDQLNRLTGARGFTPLWGEYEFNGFSPTYRTQHQYDANGNIQQLTRTAWNASSSSYEQMDSLVYHSKRRATD